MAYTPETPEKAWLEGKKLIKELVPKGDNAPNREEIRQIRKLLENVEIARQENSTIAAFFDAVSDGVVNAQKALDLRSIAYNDPLPGSNAARVKPELPTLFRIPRVSAEIQFEISSVSSHGMNIFVAQSSSQTEERMQQKVTFEVVAVPPPPRPELSQGESPAQSALRDVVITNVLQHRTVLGMIRAKKREDSAWIKQVANRVVIVRAGAGFIGFIVDEKPDTVGYTIWLYNLRDDGSMIDRKFAKSEAADNLKQFLDYIQTLQEAAFPLYEDE